MNQIIPDTENLYRLPFTKGDNPNGWIEITTHCNLRCPGCYRGCDRDDIQREHISLQKIKSTIDKMQQLRNCQIISISGGEPLLYPELGAVIQYIRQRGMIPFVHTNGILLNRALLLELRSKGLGGLIIRIDSLSGSRKRSEDQLNSEREKYTSMMAGISGIHLTYLCVVNKDNIDEIDTIIKWSIKNAGLLDFITFIPKRQILFEDNERLDTAKNIGVEDLCSKVAQVIPSIEYASYLGGTIDPCSIKWLQAPWLVFNGKIIGFAGPKFVEFFQVTHHLLRGKYAYKFGQGRSYVNFLQVLVLGCFFRSFRKITRAYLKEIIQHPRMIFNRAVMQLLCFIVPPDFINGKANICDGCPDAILYNGELVPSCALEEIKKYGSLIDKELL